MLIHVTQKNTLKAMMVSPPVEYERLRVLLNERLNSYVFT